MKNRHIARELYRRTQGQPHFSSNDLRKPPKHGKALFELFDHYNQSGRFFGDLSQEKLVMVGGFEAASHRAARGRPVRRWRWTAKAHALFGGI